MTYDLLHTISRWTKERMHRLGAVVTDSSITATEEQIWKGLSASQRRLLELRGNLRVSDTNGGGGGGNWILSSGAWNDSGVWDDASMWKDAP